MLELTDLKKLEYQGHFADEYDTPVKRIVRVAFSRLETRSRYLAMLTCYCDESGSIQDRKTPIFSLSGVVASDQQWVRFENSWGRLLRRYGVSEAFHMTDFEAVQGSYVGWPQSKRVEFASQLSGIIKSNIGYGFVYSLAVHDWKQVFGDKFSGKQMQQAPYAFLLMSVLLGIRAHPLWREPAAIVCEKNDLVEWQVRSHFDDMKRDIYRDVFESLTFSEKSHCTPLQAADILAYEGSKYWHNKKIENDRRPMRKLLSSLMSGGQIDARLFPLESLRSFKQSVERKHRDAIER